ncbi:MULTISPECIES: hypothetical protein [Pseudomonas]|uniref:Uncharacterized protein n=3 Tax=Pseudomonas TaxID=286 RepID=A0A4Q0HLZ9_PSEAZ|nr:MULTISPECIES: hypothetical protein [Pseudomonas]KRP87181.1 hypothetical protein TX25_26190 [Pseudomonas lactis]KWV68813.1 hypothetical protein PFLuk1_03493 [Pseudomonas fluorescens]KWV78749.1 hypothetical protein PFLL34_03984 [Pseudomonas fluorescens]MBA1254698.1 hypothetical protein [Pseudomonas carnis]MBA1269066.1 hypothetical protein [Pseudomonas carnis]
MTRIDSWSPWAAIIFTGGPFLLELVSIAYSLFLSHRHLDAIKEALKNSRYIYLWGPSLGRRGYIWSLLEMAKITGMIAMPRTYIRIGDLSPIDYENFPPYLKRLLNLHLAMVVGTGVWLGTVFIVLKFR